MLVALGGTAVVLTRDPIQQTIVFSMYGLLLSLLFLALQAPDVALSEIAVGAAALPLILLVTLAKTREARSMNDRFALCLFVPAAAWLAALSALGPAWPAAFGDYRGPYGVLDQRRRRRASGT